MTIFMPFWCSSEFQRFQNHTICNFFEESRCCGIEKIARMMAFMAATSELRTPGDGTQFSELAQVQFGVVLLMLQKAAGRLEKYLGMKQNAI